MRAVILTSFGGLAALELADLPEPTPGEGEEVVSVRAVALGPWDLSAADGYFRQLGGSTAFPQVQGWDFAGISRSGWPPRYRWRTSAPVMTSWRAAASVARWSLQSLRSSCRGAVSMPACHVMARRYWRPNPQFPAAGRAS
jgi:hypothetical protein